MADLDRPAAPRPANARGQLPATALSWRMQPNVPYIPAPWLYRGVFYMVKTGRDRDDARCRVGEAAEGDRATGALGEYRVAGRG